MINDNSRHGNRIVVPQQPPDPWERLAEAHLTRDPRAARRAFAQIRTQLRARWLLPWDTAMVTLGAGREMTAATRAQLAELASEGAR